MNRYETQTDQERKNEGPGKKENKKSRKIKRNEQMRESKIKKERKVSYMGTVQ